MFSCMAAVVAGLAGWVLLMVWHVQAGGAPMLLGNGMAYAALAIYATGLLGRCAAKWHPALKRVSALIGCAILAGIDVGVAGLQGEAAQKTFFAALLGIALVVLAARHAPAALRQRWLSKDSA